MTNTVKFVRITKIQENEKDCLTVGKLYAVQHIDNEGDFHIIDDENDPYYVDKWNSELVEGKEIVKCTELLIGDDDKFIVGDLYEVLSTDSDGDVRVKDMNGDRTLLVKDQFERVYVPAPEAAPVKESGKKYVRVTRLTNGDKIRKDFTIGKVYEVEDTAWGSDVVVTNEHGKRGLLLASQIEFVEKPTSHIRVTELVGYDHEKRNFTVGKVYKVIRQTERDNYIVKDDKGAESVLIKRQIEHVEGPVFTMESTEITFDGKQIASIVFNPKPEPGTKVKVTALSGIDFMMVEIGKVYNVIEKDGKDYIIALSNSKRYRISGERVVEVNY